MRGTNEEKSAAEPGWFASLVAYPLMWLGQYDARVEEWFRRFRAGTSERLERLKFKPARKIVPETVIVSWLLVTAGGASAHLVPRVLCLLEAALTGDAPACAPGPLYGLPWGAVLAGQFALSALALFAFYFLARWIIAITNEVAESRADLVPTNESRARVLIMGLSPADPEAAVAEAHRYAGQLAAYAAPIGAGGPEGVAWQQNVRMVHHHRESLEQIYVLPSDQTLDLVPAFRNYLAVLFETEMPVVCVLGKDGQPVRERGAPEGAQRNYESYDYVHGGLKRAVELAREAVPGIAERNICIDATAGQKTFSVAAGIVTLNRDLRLGYVTSRSFGPDGRKQGGEVRIYDPRITFVTSLAAASRG